MPAVSRRAAFLGAGAIMIAGLLVGRAAVAQPVPPIYLRIATGASGGGYFRIGGLIGNAISKPPGAPACSPSPAAQCGVPGLITLTQATSGSVDNIRAVEDRRVELALAQADVVDAAVAGRNGFAERGPVQNLRAIAKLYTEFLHLIVRADSEIASVEDLRGRRVGLDMLGSGTEVVAQAVLEAYDVPVEAMTPHHVRPNEAMDMLAAGLLDAVFMMAGYPVNSVLHGAETAGIRLVAVAGPELEPMLAQQKYLGIGAIPAGTYGEMAELPTVEVQALLVVGAQIDEELVYEITRALWHPNALRMISEGHPRGKELILEQATRGLPVVLHPGAARYYSEAGLLGPEPDSPPEVMPRPEDADAGSIPPAESPADEAGPP